MRGGVGLKLSDHHSCFNHKTPVYSYQYLSIVCHLIFSHVYMYIRPFRLASKCTYWVLCIVLHLYHNLPYKVTFSRDKGIISCLKLEHCIQYLLYLFKVQHFWHTYTDDAFTKCTMHCKVHSYSMYSSPCNLRLFSGARQQQ